MSTINNAANYPLFSKAGTTPDVSGALQDYYQSMVFTKVTKTVVGGQLVESLTPVNFRGVIQPLTERQLAMKPEGQRSWTWMTLHCDPTLVLNTDDIVLWNNIPTRVMGRLDYTLYGYVVYSIAQDWTGS